MREKRGVSQILFGFLPQQTVDLRGAVWRVARWSSPVPIRADEATVRSALELAAMPWASVGNDGGLVEDLRRGRGFNVVSLSHEEGVSCEEFPKVWFCRQCKRLTKERTPRCRCGNRPSWAQLHFVGYHSCGRVIPPNYPTCPVHGEARIRLPGTAKASEIRFECPECGRLLRRGLGFTRCECGQGNVSWNVHRAASVYSPRSTVVVNPPDVETARLYKVGDGPTKALDWVLDACAETSPLSRGASADSLRASLEAQGLDQDTVERMVELAIQGGQLASAGEADLDILSDSKRQIAEEGAVEVATAFGKSRVRLEDLRDRAAEGSEQRRTIEEEYPSAFARAGIESVDLVSRFPILTMMFGFTRGDPTPGAATLVPFRDRRGQLMPHGDQAETEALMVRLDPTRVARWLESRGHSLRAWQDRRSARLAVLEGSDVPPTWDLGQGNSMGLDLLKLVHSMCHRWIRRLAVHAGVDMNSLSEYLVPSHSAFFVYAAARGGFVLGGLQAVFERSLHLLVKDVVSSERRCPLDPGCGRTGGACLACLHIGEPSCRLFNQALSREVLFGARGYLSEVEPIADTNDQAVEQRSGSPT